MIRAEMDRLRRAAVGTATDARFAGLAAAGQTLTAALERYGADLARAQHQHAVATRDVERNAALALAARARRRLRLTCVEVTTAATGRISIGAYTVAR